MLSVSSVTLSLVQFSKEEVVLLPGETLIARQFANSSEFTPLSAVTLFTASAASPILRQSLIVKIERLGKEMSFVVHCVND